MCVFIAVNNRLYNRFQTDFWQYVYNFTPNNNFGFLLISIFNMALLSQYHCYFLYITLDVENIKSHEKSWVFTDRVASISNKCQEVTQLCLAKDAYPMNSVQFPNITVSTDDGHCDGCKLSLISNINSMFISRLSGCYFSYKPTRKRTRSVITSQLFTPCRINYYL